MNLGVNEDGDIIRVSREIGSMLGIRITMKAIAKSFIIQLVYGSLKSNEKQ